MVVEPAALVVMVGEWRLVSWLRWRLVSWLERVKVKVGEYGYECHSHSDPLLSLLILMMLVNVLP